MFVFLPQYPVRSVLNVTAFQKKIIKFKGIFYYSYDFSIWFLPSKKTKKEKQNNFWWRKLLWK